MISRNYDGRKACHGCGICNGCPRGSMSKFSTSVWPKALEAGVELRTYARVLRIEKDRSGRATGAEYIDRTTGRRHFQKASVVILAANGVGTPRLLLASDNLANSSDQVGRNLLHHTLVACEMWVDEPLAAHTGYVAAMISREFAETDLSRGFVNGFNFNCVTTGGAGEQAIGFLSDNRAPWGAGHHQWFERHFGHGFGVFAIGDDLPHPDNRITLSASEKDEDGIPVASLFYEPRDNDRKMMRYMLDRLVEIAKAADAFEYRLQDYTGAGRRLPHAGLAPARHRPDGQDPGHVGGQQVAPVLGRAQPADHRRQRPDHRRGGEPDLDDHRPGPARRRGSARQLRRAQPHHQADGRMT